MPWAEAFPNRATLRRSRAPDQRVAASVGVGNRSGLGIRHANRESGTRIGPRTDLDGRSALVDFCCRSRAASPASNEPEGDEHEESHVACHHFTCTCTVRFLAEFRATPFRKQNECIRLLISKSR